MRRDLPGSVFGIFDCRVLGVESMSLKRRVTLEAFLGTHNWGFVMN